MRKPWFCALMISLPLALCACGAMSGGSDEEPKKNSAQLLQEEYQTLESCDMTATLRCDRESEVEEYTLRCHWNADGTSTVEVVEPEELAGICAELDGEDLTLTYDDVSLAAGTLGSEELSPVQCLPLIVDAIRDGYILQKGTEEVDGTDCRRWLFDVTGTQGGKIQYAVWFGAGHAPVKAEVITEEAVIFTVNFTEFSAEEEQTDLEAEV